MAGHPLLVVLGPTASGKSELALELARRSGADLLSVDSMQVYRHMDIGTAKPSPAERQEVRHHLVNVVDPDQAFTVAAFVERADQAIAAARQRGVSMIASGGTPLYYKNLFEGLFAGPGADASLRERLRTETNSMLHHRLSQVDPAAAERIHPNDKKRLVRALEVYELTGRRISDLQREWGTALPRHQAVWIGLNWDRDALNRRINARVKAMISAGWLDETRALLARFGTLSPTASEATGYAELIRHLRGELSLDEAVEQIKIATRQLARRQLKWFRRFPHVHWLPGDAPLQEKVSAAMTLWDAG